MKIKEVTENQIDEIAPLAIAGGIAARAVFGWAIKRGGPPVLKWLARKATKWGIIGAGAVKLADWTWDKVTELVGEEIAMWLMKNKVPLAIVATIIIAAAGLKEYIQKDKLSTIESAELNEIYKQKDGDYARDGGPMPKKKKRGPHPLGGKLVG